LAREIHAASPRSESPFIPVDCTGITGSLFASQLFGHRKGAFTGAQYEALGCFRAAEGGTIFLDEIGELELSLQAKLLRALQERVVLPLGGHDPLPIDIRVIAATNRDLRAEVTAGRFREDLYFRLAVVELESLPLARRREDIGPLSEHFLQELSTQHGLPRCQLSPGALEALEHFSWPGNIRQLRHLLEHAVITSNATLINLPQIQSLLDGAYSATRHSVEPAPAAVPRCAPSPESGAHRRQPAPYSAPVEAAPRVATPRAWPRLDQLERDHILVTLEHTYYNQTAAARLLGVTRQTLSRRIEKYGLALPEGDPSLVRHTPR
jgi:DNA-binding NtrC family response regulator